MTPCQMDPDPFTSAPEATLRCWRHLGTGPHGFRIGRSARYWQSDVMHWLEMQPRHPRAGN